MCGFDVHEETRPEGTFVVIDGIRHDDDCAGGCLMDRAAEASPSDDWESVDLFADPE